MPISPADFVFSLAPDPLQAVIGFNTTAQFSFSNTNLVDKAFNLSLTATLPDGVSFVSSDVVPTQIVNNPGGTLTLTWINIKDLAPNELNYILGLTLKSDAVFRATGLPVPFDIPLVTVSAAATVDTLPRGNDDPGNVKITKLDNANFIPLRYSLTKSSPGKMPKGAGLLIPVTPERWPYTYTLTVLNNINVPSTVTLVDTLPNGIRYLVGCPHCKRSRRCCSKRPSGHRTSNPRFCHIKLGNGHLIPVFHQHHYLHRGYLGQLHRGWGGK